MFCILPFITKSMKESIYSALVAACIVVMAGCHNNLYRDANRLYRKQVKQYAKALRGQPATAIAPPPYWVGTTNFNLRKPNVVVIHHTAQNSCAQTLKTFTTVQSQVSAHYVICKDGTVHHMLNDYLRAWHGGAGRWGNITDINSSSIGIELDNNGLEAFTDPQVRNLLVLLDTLKKRYNIPAANFIGHSDVAPTRKVDPNVLFPWKQLADSGFGLWYGDTTGISVPQQFNTLQALRVIGYDTRDSVAVIGAFKRKYLQQEGSREWGEPDRKVLYALYRQYQ